jgi:hypothetical protein
MRNIREATPFQKYMPMTAQLPSSPTAADVTIARAIAEHATPKAVRKVIYRASPTLDRVHRSRAFVRGVRGPMGRANQRERALRFRRGREQVAGSDGKRHTRFAIVRNTYRELADTTLKTRFDWLPEKIWDAYNHQDLTHHIVVDDVDQEIMFCALDRPQDIKKVLSLDLTRTSPTRWRALSGRLASMGMTDRLGFVKL